MNSDDLPPLREVWERRGAVFGLRSGATTPVRFAQEPSAEAAAARSRPVFFERRSRGALVRLTGADRAGFLHGQCTQDVKTKAPGEGGSAWVLDARGKNDGLLRFVVFPDRIELEVEPEHARRMVARLRRFVITADVEVLPYEPEPVHFSVAGPGAAALLLAATGVVPPPTENFGTVFDRDGVAGAIVANFECGAAGWDVRLFRAAGAAAPVAEAILGDLEGGGALPVGDDAAEILRVEAGRPRYGRDVDETTLPAESGRLDATTSFTKGCYAGQEVVAKQQYLGRPRRLLVLATGAGAPPASGTPLRNAAGEDVGRTATAVVSPLLDATLVIASVRPDDGALGARLLLPDGAELRVVPPPAAAASAG